MREKARNSSFIKRLLSIFAAIAMVLTMSGISAVPAFAADGTITINPPTGETGNTTYNIYKVFDAESVSTTTGGVTTANARYSILSTKNGVPDVATQVGANYNAASDPHFIVDTAGNVHYGTEQTNAVTTGANQTTDITVADSSASGGTKTVHFLASNELTSAAIAAIAEYVKNDTPTTTATSTNGGQAVVNNVDDGYYYITTTVGTAVTITTNTPNATVDDKNEVPSLDKKITAVKEIESSGDNAADAGSIDSDGKNAIAQVGSAVTYQIRVNFGKGSKNVKLHDKMGTGLAKMANSSLNVTFHKNKTGEQTEDQTITDNSTSPNYWWTYKEQAYKDVQTKPENAPERLVVGAPDNDDTMTITFKDGIDQEADYAIVSYTLQVTNDALQVNLARNTAKVTYGDNHSTTEDHTRVYNAKFTVTKHNGSGVGLAGAGFKLTRSVQNSNGGYTTQYYKYTAASTNTETNVTTPAKVEWVTNADQATEYMSGSDGKLYAIKTTGEGSSTVREADTDGGEKTFAGLPDGTYTLIESTVPRGYNKAADYTFTVKGANATLSEGQTPEKDIFVEANLSQSTTVVNNQGSILPSTGGIGTTIFYTIGGILVAGAVVLLVLRRRRRA